MAMAGFQVVSHHFRERYRLQRSTACMVQVLCMEQACWRTNVSEKEVFFSPISTCFGDEVGHLTRL